MNIDLQVPVLEQYPPSPFKLFWLIGSVYHTDLQDCAISTWAGMWEQGSVQGFIIFSAPQWQGEKNMFEYFFFSKTSVM
jgi:hypothetical protein